MKMNLMQEYIYRAVKATNTTGWQSVKCWCNNNHQKTAAVLFINGGVIKYSTSNIIAYYDIFIEYNFYTDTYLVSLRLSSISAKSDITDIEQYASKQLTWKYLK